MRRKQPGTKGLHNESVDQAFTDGNLVTAPAWPAHPAWMAQFFKVLGTKIEL